MLRLAHFSDVHLTARPLGWRRRDLLSKKIAGWANVRLLGRGLRFRHSVRVVEALRREFVSRDYAQLIFSGDATKLAFDREFELSAHRLGVRVKDQPPGIAVPGNHDYYTKDACERRLFDTHFAPWLEGTRVDDALFPFARKVGEAWLIAVNSCTANWWTFDASGAIGAEQLIRLKKLCDALDHGPRILITHYPLRASRRQLERRSHRLRDHVAALEVAKSCQIGLWLHGHIHKPYILPAGNDLPFHTICAGSCTQTNRWSFFEYTLDGGTLHVQQRKYSFAEHSFVDGLRTTLKWVGGAA